jgi:hypothetical protein
MAEEGNGFTIHIDKKPYPVASSTMTGQQIRDLVPVPTTRDLWLEVPDGQDLKIEPARTYEVDEDMNFYTAPAEINPGY